MMNQNYYGFPSYSPQRPLEIVKVNGKNGAMAYSMPPNSSVLLLDVTAPIVWLKTTDGASYPSITGYNITPIQEEIQQPLTDDYSKLEERIERLEKMIDGKSDNASSKQTHKQNQSQS